MLIQSSGGASDKVGSRELLSLAASLTDEIELTKAEPYRKGVKTLVRAFCAVDPEAIYAVSASVFEHEPIDSFKRSRVGRFFFGKSAMVATLVVFDLLEPDNNLELMIFPNRISFLRGETGISRDMCSSLTVGDVAFVNRALTTIMHGASVELQ